MNKTYPNIKEGDEMITLKSSYHYVFGTVIVVSHTSEIYYDKSYNIYAKDEQGRDLMFSNDELEFKAVYNSPLKKALRE